MMKGRRLKGSGTELFEEMSQQFLDGMKNANENLSQYNRSFGRDFITAASIHKTEAEISSNKTSRRSRVC